MEKKERAIECAPGVADAVFPDRQVLYGRGDSRRRVICRNGSHHFTRRGQSRELGTTSKRALPAEMCCWWE